MGWSGFLGRQLRRPTGLFGRFVIPLRLRRLNTAINAATLSALELVPDDRVLEIGFGPGELLAAVATVVTSGRVTGADFSREMVQAASRRLARDVRAGHVDLHEASADSLPFPDASFTKLCTVNTVYFWDDPAAVLCEFARVMVPGGRLVVSFSPRETLESLNVTREVFTLYDEEELAGLLKETGFEGVQMIPGDGPLGAFVCAVATRSLHARSNDGPPTPG